MIYVIVMIVAPVDACSNKKWLMYESFDQKNQTVL
jgi:hypothetical protein